jgi:hypothetical protein
MIRKSLFLGLTLVLIVALINLIIRGRRLEKEKSSKLVEVVKDSEPTPTRVLAPQDLEIIQSTMKLVREAAVKQLPTARHEIEIRNVGKVSYGEIQLRVVYLDRNGKVLTTKTRSIAQTILPGITLKFADILIDGVPASAAACRVTIVYADMGLAAQTGCLSPFSPRERNAIDTSGSAAAVESCFENRFEIENQNCAMHAGSLFMHLGAAPPMRYL